MFVIGTKFGKGGARRFKVGHRLLMGASVRAIVAVACAAAMVLEAIPPGEAHAALADDLQKHLIQTVSPSGTTINLFDYWVNDADESAISGDNGGINRGHTLKFNNGDLNGGAAGSGEGPNAWTGGADRYGGIVKDKLENGCPVLSGTNYLDEESLAYLFDAFSGSGKKAHIGTTGLLKAANGYYVYDTTNFASFNVDSNSFSVYDTWGIKGSGASYNANGQFFPFAPIDEVFEEERGGALVQTDVNADAPGLNHHFGMSMSSRFVQPRDGVTPQGDAMVFEFSGDDDVWVFVDDILVGDLGGIHNEATLSIDFKTGDVKINGRSDGTMRGKFESAGAETSAFDGGSSRFKDGTQHTLRFFYLERGAGASNMSLKFNLVNVPNTDIVKVDQHGDPVAGAGFTLYRSNANWEEVAQLATGVTDVNGGMVLTEDDGTVLSFDELYERDTSPNHADSTYYLLKETRIPAGYKAPLEYTDKCMHLQYIYSDQMGSGYFVDPAGTETSDSWMWKNGASIVAKEVITAPNDPVEDETGEKVDVSQGTLFAVAFKKTKADGVDSWAPIYGSPVEGYKVLSGGAWDDVIAAAKGDEHVFTLTASGQLQVELDDLPGDIAKYYLLMDEDERDQAEYTVALYFTTAANGLNGATDANTVRLKNDGFERQFASTMYITNVKDRLFVMKVDDAGNPVAEAEFTLYKADQVNTDGGVVRPIDEDVYYDRLVTQEQLTAPVKLSGAGVFPLTAERFNPLSNGVYYLKETGVPAGYEINDEYVKVIVDDTGVYADAGAKDDGIKTFSGAGNLLASLGQYGENDDVNNTLTWIRGSKQTGVLGDAGAIEWGSPSTAPDDIVDLEYGAAGGALQYGPAEPGGAFRIYCDEGINRLYIQQADENKDPDSKGTWTNLGAMQINQLFTGATCVQVTNERTASIEVTKRVSAAAGLAPDPDAAFPFEFTFDGAGSDGALTYKARVFEADGSPVGDADLDIETGSVVTLKADQTIRVYGVPEDVRYTVREVTTAESPTPFNLFGLLNAANAPQMPEGFTLVSRTLNGEEVAGQGDEIEAVADAVADVLVFTNLYEVKPVVLPDAAKISAKKVLTGRTDDVWIEADAYTVVMGLPSVQPAGGGAQVAADDTASVTITKDTPDHTATFGLPRYDAPGDHVSYIYEVDPSVASGERVPGVTYSDALYRVAATTVDNGDGTMRVTKVVLDMLIDDVGNAVPVDNQLVGSVTFDEDGTSATHGAMTVVIKNTFQNDTATASLQAFKVFTDTSGGHTLAGNEFKFTLRPVSDTVDGTTNTDEITLASMPRPRNAATPEDGSAWPIEQPVAVAGEASFGDFTFSTESNAGHTYVYELTEVMPAGATAESGYTVDGMRYDSKVYRVEYAVSNPADTNPAGDLAVGVSWSIKNEQGEFAPVDEGDLTDRGFPYFSNTYQALPTELPLELSKAVDGRSWGNGEKFIFDVAVTSGDATAVDLPGQEDAQEAGVYELEPPAGTALASGEPLNMPIGNVAFSKVGTYVLTLAERPGSAVGMAYDTAPRSVTVEVADDGTGKLVATVLDASGAVATEQKIVASFTNIYRATGAFAGIDVTKVMEGHDLLENSYEFTVERTAYDSSGNVIEDSRRSESMKCGTAAAGEKFSFNEDYGDVFFEGKLTQEQIGYPHIFRVTEAAVHPGTVGYEDDANAGYVVLRVVPDADDASALHAEYAVAKGPKTSDLVGSDGSKRAKLLDEAVLEGLGDEVVRGSTENGAAAGGVMPTVNFANKYEAVELDYGAAGGLVIEKTFTYKNAASWLTRDFSFAVTPKATEVSRPDGTTQQLTSAGDAGALLGMTDEEIAQGKTIAIPDVQANADDPATVSLVPSGGLTFEQGHIGKTYTYEVREVIPSTADGVAYDDSVYTVTIAVRDNEDGRIKVVTQVVKDSYLSVYTYVSGEEVSRENAARVPFANAYAPIEADVSVAINATKQLTGRPLVDGEFAFEVRNAAPAATGDGPVSTGVNDASGKVAFDNITYTLDKLCADVDAGKATASASGDSNAVTYTYQYSVSEVTDGLADQGIAGVATSFAVTVSVTDDGTGALSAAVTYPEGSGDVLAFKNAYGSGATTTVSLSGTKVLDVESGDNAPTLSDIAGKYEFTLAPAEGFEGAPMPGDATVRNDAAGNVSFGEITYTMEDVFGADPLDGESVSGGSDASGGEAGAPSEMSASSEAEVPSEVTPTSEVAPAERTRVFRYTISESGTVPGIANDPDTKTVEVTVTDNGDGIISAIASKIEGGANFSFTNTYSVVPTSPSSVSDAIAITKTLGGRDLREGEFSFELIETVDGVERVVSEGVNAADGSVGMRPIVYDGPGVHSYVLREVHGSADGVTYDDAAHRVQTTVKDSGDGTLSVSHVLLDANGNPARDQSVVFANSYTEPKDPIDPIDPSDPGDSGDRPASPDGGSGDGKTDGSRLSGTGDSAVPSAIAACAFVGSLLVATGGVLVRRRVRDDRPGRS